MRQLMDVPVIGVQVLANVPVTSNVQKTIHALVDMRVPISYQRSNCSPQGSNLLLLCLSA
jgi:hypothetical protein